MIAKTKKELQKDSLNLIKIYKDIKQKSYNDSNIVLNDFCDYFENNKRQNSLYNNIKWQVLMTNG